MAEPEELEQLNRLLEERRKHAETLRKEKQKAEFALRRKEQEFSKLERTVAELKQKNEALETAIDSLEEKTKEHADLQKAYKDLQNKHENLKSEQDALMGHLDRFEALKTDHRKAKKRLMRIKQAMEEMNGVTPSDPGDSIQTGINGLFNDFKSLHTQHEKLKSEQDSLLDALSRKNLQVWTPDRIEVVSKDEVQLPSVRAASIEEALGAIASLPVDERKTHLARYGLTEKASFSEKKDAIVGVLKALGVKDDEVLKDAVATGVVDEFLRLLKKE